MLRRAVLACAVAGLCAGAAAAQAAVVERAPLSTDGSRIVDKTGRTLIIQGVNWFGFETSNHVVHGLWRRDYKQMLSQVHQLGFNAVRVPFSLQMIGSTTTSGIDFGGGRNAALQGKTPLQALDEIVAEARRQDLLVLLDNHSLSDDGFQHDLWYGQGGYSEDDWVAAWKTMARRYGDDPNVVGADLKNEPHGAATWGTGGPSDWRRAATRAGNAIQAIAPQWLIVVEGIEGHTDGQQLTTHWWGGNLEGVRRNPITLATPHKLVYSPHEYGPGVFNQPWFSAPDMSAQLENRWSTGFGYITQRNIAPVLVGEFGGRSTGTDTTEGRWQRQFMDYLSRTGTSWTYWAWNPNSGDTGGILNEDWTTTNTAKVGLLQALMRGERIGFTPGNSTPPPEPNPDPLDPTPTDPPPPPPPVTPGSLTAKAQLESSWDDGYCAAIKVTNTGSSAVRAAKVTFALHPRATITQSWSGIVARSGSAVSATLPDWAGPLAAGASATTFGFCVSYTGTRPLPSGEAAVT